MTETLIPDGDINAGTTGFQGGSYLKVDEGVDTHDSMSTIYNTFENAGDGDKWMHMTLPTPVGEIDTTGTFTVKVINTLAWGSSYSGMKIHIYEDGVLISSSSAQTISTAVGTWVEYEYTGLAATGITDKTKLEIRHEATGGGGKQVRTTAIDVIAPIVEDISSGAGVSLMIMGAGG